MEANKLVKTKTEELIHTIRNTPVFRQLVPMEAVSGWPIPFRKNGKVYMKVPFYGAANKGKGSTVLYPPFAVITVEYSSKMIVEYNHMRYSNPWTEANWDEPVGKFPHEAVAKMVVRDYKSSKKSLMELYDVMVESLLSGNPLDTDTEKKFAELLSILMEPGLKPYYEAISPKFFGYFLKG